MKEEYKNIRIGDFQMLFSIWIEEYREWTKLNKAIKIYENEGKVFNFSKIGELSIPLEDYKFAKEINELQFELNKRYTKTIIFLAIYLEAIIFDYAATYLGDTYMKKYLDKLDVVSKWKVIPKLVTGKQINSDNNKYGYLKKIISRRNLLIHNKSKNIKSILENNQIKEDKLSLKLCIECLEYLLSEIYKITPDFSPLVNHISEIRKVLKST